MGSAHPIVQHSLEIARGEAARLGHDYVGTEHMLLGLLKLATGSFADLLRRINLDGQLVRTEIERIITPVSTHPGTAEISVNAARSKGLRIAMQQAEARNHSGMSAEDVFFGLLLEGSGVAARALKNLGVGTEKVREAIDANQLRDN
jgi:ATP-dependent Clp protease ATP-binding subunit ClpC